MPLGDSCSNLLDELKPLVIATAITPAFLADLIYHFAQLRRSRSKLWKH